MRDRCRVDAVEEVVEEVLDPTGTAMMSLRAGPWMTS